MLQFGEYLKRSRHDSHKSAKKYINAFDSFFGLQVVSKTRIFIDRLVGRLRVQINKAKETYPDCISDFEKIEHAIDREDIQTIMLGVSTLSDEDGEIRKRDLFNALSTSIEGGVSQRCFDLIFNNTFDKNKSFKINFIAGQPIQMKQKKPIYFFGDTLTVQMRREIHEYNSRYYLQMKRSPNTVTANYTMSNPNYPFYSSRLFALLDLQSATSFTSTIASATFIPIRQKQAFLIFGERHHPSPCFQAKPTSISIGKFLVDLVNACPDVQFELMFENAPLVNEYTEMLRTVPFGDKQSCIDAFMTIRINTFHKWKKTSPSLDQVRQLEAESELLVTDGFVQNTYRYFFPIYPVGSGHHNETIMPNVRLHSADIREMGGDRRDDAVFSYARDIQTIGELQIIGVDFLNQTFTSYSHSAEHVTEFPRVIKKAEQKLNNETLLRKIRTVFNELFEKTYKCKVTDVYERAVSMGRAKPSDLIYLKLHEETTSSMKALLTDYYAILRSLRFVGTDQKTICVFYAGNAHAMHYVYALRKIFNSYPTCLDDANPLNITSTLGVYGYIDHRITDDDVETIRIKRIIKPIMTELDDICLTKYTSENELNSAFQKLRNLNETGVPELIQQLPERDPEREPQNDIRNIVVYVLSKILNVLSLMHIEASSSRYLELDDAIKTYKIGIESNIQNEIHKLHTRSEE